MELAHQNPSRVSVPELLKELQVTKNELENIKVSLFHVNFTIISTLIYFCQQHVIS